MDNYTYEHESVVIHTFACILESYTKINNLTNVKDKMIEKIVTVAQNIKRMPLITHNEVLHSIDAIFSKQELGI